MKRCATIMLLPILIGIVFVLNLRANDVMQGRYVPSVVLTALWDKKNLSDHGLPSELGKFGFSLDESGLAHGPTAFTVAPNGDIYIADNMNKRIQRFSASGSFLKSIPNAWGEIYAGLAVDEEGNIYCPNTYATNPSVHKFDQNGNLLKIYPIAKDEDMGTDKPYNWSATGISCDDSGRVFMQYTKYPATPLSFQIGAKDAEFSPSQQKSSLKEVQFGATANVPNMNKIFREDGLLGVDKDAVYTMEKDEKNPYLATIKRTTYDGRLLCIYSVDWSQAKCTLLTSFSMNKHTVFDKGYVYSFCSDKEGIKIIKWSPVEGK